MLYNATRRNWAQWFDVLDRTQTPTDTTRLATYLLDHHDIQANWALIIALHYARSHRYAATAAK